MVGVVDALHRVDYTFTHNSPSGSFEVLWNGSLSTESFHLIASCTRRIRSGVFAIRL